MAVTKTKEISHDVYVEVSHLPDRTLPVQDPVKKEKSRRRRNEEVVQQ